MSSWLERLNKLTLPTTNSTYQLDTVFVDGSKFTKQSILQEIQKEYSWAAVSKINFDTLYVLYNENITKVLSHLINDRSNLMIYENSNESVHLIQIVQDYLLKNPNINLDCLTSLYKKSCHILQDESTRKSILILDCRREYFASHGKHHENELYLHTFAHLALLKKRYLFPFMEVIIIRNSENVDVDHKTNVYHRKLNELLDNNLYVTDKVLDSFNRPLIKNTIINAHKSKWLPELDLY